MSPLGLVTGISDGRTPAHLMGSLSLRLPLTSPRPLGQDKWLCVEQKVLLVTNPGKARDLARQAMAFYLPLTNYRVNWARLGFSEDDLAGGGSDRFLDAMVAWGDQTAIRTRIKAHFDAGASHVCVQPLHSEGQPLPDLNALAALA
jgi:probable F420-dependent oxidoreductase